MAKCKKCGADIPEGAEYCEKCLSEVNTAKDSESYLDSLLNAIMTEVPERREVVFRQRKASSPVSAPQEEKTAPEKTEKAEKGEAAEMIEKVEEGESVETAQQVEDTGNIADIEGMESVESIGDMADIEEAVNAGDFSDIEDIGSTIAAESLGDMENVESTEPAEEFGTLGDIEDIGSTVAAEALGDMENVESTEPAGDIWNMEEVGGTEPAEEFGTLGNIEDIGSTVAAEALGDMENVENTETAGNTWNMEDIGGTEAVGSVGDIGTAQGSGSTEDTESAGAGKSPDRFLDLKQYNIFDEMNEADVERMLDADLQAEFGEIELEESLADFLKEIDEEPEPDFSGEDGPEIEAAGAEDGVADDFSDLFEDGEFAPEEPATLDSAEADDFADLFANDEESGTGSGEDVKEAEAAVSDEPQGEAAALFSNLNEMQEDMDVAEEKNSNLISDDEIEPDLQDLFAGLGEEGEELLEFGTEQEEMEELLKRQVPDIAEDVPAEKSKKKNASDETSEEDSPKKKKKEKKGKGPIATLYHRLFDNVELDPSEIKQPLTKEEIEAKKKAAKEAKERSKEEKEAQIAEKKEQERLVKAEKQQKEREAKEEKKARKLEEAKLLLEEMEKTRINRAGASIVFIFFGMIAVVILVGTSIFSYSLSIRNAAYEFNRDEYTRAYNEIFGLDIKDEDIVLYDRIMTVMYVQKQLNSYYNYYEMKDYPKALDSLLKGLQRYEKYIELAVELDVDSDLDSVRSGILTEIDASFSMSEHEAMEIIQSASQLEYSIKVYDAAEKVK